MPWRFSFAAAGCRRQAPAAAAAAVATFDGGRVSTADVDRAVLDLPAERRQPADGDLLAWYERIARDLAMQAILVAEARQAGLDQGPDFERAREEARRQAVVAVFLEKEPPRRARSQPARRSRRTIASTRRTSRARPPDRRITCSGVSRPAPTPRPSWPRCAASEDASSRETTSASWPSEFSESESRHQRGLLGWVTPGKVSPELERVIFSLQPRVPSQPLKTAAGVHLFLVSAEAPAKTLTLPEVRNAIGVVLAGRRRKAAVERLVGSGARSGQLRAVGRGAPGTVRSR